MCSIAKYLLVLIIGMHLGWKLQEYTFNQLLEGLANEGLVQEELVPEDTSKQKEGMATKVWL